MKRQEKDNQPSNIGWNSLLVVLLGLSIVLVGLAEKNRRIKIFETQNIAPQITANQIDIAKIISGNAETEKDYTKSVLRKNNTAVRKVTRYSKTVFLP